MYKVILTVITLIFIVLSAERYYGSAYVSRVISVYDGDTFKANMAVYWPAIIRDTISIRISGIDTPEMRGSTPAEKALAIQARDLVTVLLSGGRVKLVNMFRDKYFRINAEVYVNGISVGDSLIRAGLARPYDGGTKEPWVIDTLSQ